VLPLWPQLPRKRVQSERLLSQRTDDSDGLLHAEEQTSFYAVAQHYRSCDVDFVAICYRAVIKSSVLFYMFQRLKEIKWRKADEPLTTRQKVAEKSSWIISTGRLLTAQSDNSINVLS